MSSYANEDGEPYMDAAAWRFEQALDEESLYDDQFDYDDYDDYYDEEE